MVKGLSAHLAWLVFGLRAPDVAVDEETARRIRGEQVSAIVELVPMSAIANVLCAAVIAVAFQGTDAAGFAPFWALSVVAFSGMAMRNWWKSRLKTRIGAGPRAISRLTANSLILGVLWGMAPLFMLSGADVYHQLLLQILVTGMTAGGAFGLSTVPRAGLTYVWVIVASSMAAMLISTDASESGNDVIVVSMWLGYGAYLSRNIAIHAARFFENARNRAELTEKNEVIGLLLRDFQEHGGDWLWETDAEGRLADPSPRLAEAAGRTIEELAAMPLRALLAAGQAEGGDELLEAMEWYEIFRDLVVTVRVDDDIRHWSLTGRPIFRGNGAFCGYQGVGSDITERRAAEERIAFLAETDPVTGLVNRAKFSEVLERAMIDPANQGRNILFYLDLDQFKSINDTMGHPVGDALLDQVGRRLVDCAGPQDVVARIGGDEFAILIPGSDRPDHAVEIAEKILATFDLPFTLDGADFSVGTSIGIAIGPEDGATPMDLMKSADLALYRAKAEGRDGFRFFEPGMDEKARRRRLLEQGLRNAMDTDQLYLVYQPIVDLVSDRISGFETLVRWKSPEFGNVSPTEFIPIAEECKLIVPIGEWILHEATRQAATWPRDIRVSINLSPVQFRNRRLLATIVSALEHSRLQPHRLQVEITESTLLDAGDHTLNMLRDLRELGVRVALDDFGTGYSSLNYLRKFPFDKIKIDKSFVDDIDQREQSRAIVRAIMELTTALGMSTVAEGVETSSQLSTLRDLGCDEIQGYVISAAVENEAIPEMLSANYELTIGDLVEPMDLELVDAGCAVVAA
ncbi:MAG: EAL domain-containing protein [Siculibacillus sp.]|nr:EAL domain-containing protein [Siculibacillus sp.]